ncbi:MAG: ribonuclease HII [Candidatus Saccharimonadales bacterium]
MITVGMDEVGRGCWAGPLVAGAVILHYPIKGLKDSKKLTKLQREKLTKQIYEEAVAVGLGWVNPAEIDEIGLTKAVGLAMKRALAQITIEYDEMIIDGDYNFFPAEPRAKAIIKADDSVPAVSAASIVAKVARDDYMAEVSAQYPGYAFEKHVGYGTAAHLAALKLLGVSDMHRLSYKPIQKLLA